MKLQMKENQASGLLITFCGLDGCGKSTLISLLAEWLNNINKTVKLTKQPTESVRQSSMFRSYMDQSDHDDYDYRALSLLCASDRVQHTNKVIKPMLDEVDIVISDRYFYSCLANLISRGYEQDKWIYEISKSIIKPDIAFFLDVPVETAIERVRIRPSEKNRYIDIPLQYKLRDQYLKIADENDGIVIDTTESIENSLAKVKDTLDKLLFLKSVYIKG